MMYGFFSPRCAELHGSCFWTTPDGGTVEVTHASPYGDGGGDWPDKIAMGEVVKYAKDGRRPEWVYPRLDSGRVTHIRFDEPSLVKVELP